MTEEEKQLISDAQYGTDEEANKAMEELRDKFDKSYGWCSDCDYLVVKESECCMNRNRDEETKD